MVSPSFDKVIHVRLKSLPVTENGCRSTLVVEPTFLWMASQDPWIEETCYFTDKVASFLATTNLSPSSRFSLLVVSLFVWTRVQPWGLSVTMQFVKMHHKVNNRTFELLRPRTFDSIFSFPADVKEAKQGKERRSARSPGCGPPKATPVVGRFVSEIQRCDGTNRFSLSLCLMATMMMTPIMAITWDVVPHWQVEVGEEAGVSATWPMPILAKQFYTKIITHPPPVPTVLHWIWNLKLTRDAILKLSFPIPLRKCICFFFFINNTF